MLQHISVSHNIWIPSLQHGTVLSNKWHNSEVTTRLFMHKGTRLPSTSFNLWILYTTYSPRDTQNKTEGIITIMKTGGCLRNAHLNQHQCFHLKSFWGCFSEDHRQCQQQFTSCSFCVCMCFLVYSLSSTTELYIYTAVAKYKLYEAHYRTIYLV